MGWGEGIVREFGKVMCILLYSKQITNKDLWYSTGDSTQSYVLVLLTVVTLQCIIPRDLVIL